jgi:hypothetical protein
VARIGGSSMSTLLWVVKRLAIKHSN